MTQPVSDSGQPSPRLSPVSRLLVAAIAIYNYTLSPLLHSLSPSACRFEPTCSTYAADAIRIHGALRGSALALRRLSRCHPFGGSGYDPVPSCERKEKKNAGELLT